VTAVLHIYGQQYWHCDATIVGTREALETLRDTITKALEGKPAATGNVWASDGEGYQVTVAQRDDLSDLPDQYLDDDLFPDAEERWRRVAEIIREATCPSNR
jgi:hypothetical protein